MALGSISHADDSKAAARQSYRRALQHYNLAEWAPALASFTEAYRLYEEPSFLFNIAQCHRQLGHQQDAITFYKSYLRNTPDAKNRDEVLVLITRLEASLAAESAAKKAPPQDARESAVITPAPVALDPPPPPVVVVPPADSPPPRHAALRYTGYALIAVGSAAIVAGGGLLGAAVSDQTYLNQPHPNVVWDGSRVDQMQTFEKAGYAMLGVGIGVAVVGVVLAVVGRNHPTTRASLRTGTVTF